MLGMILLTPSNARGDGALEAQVKAVFILNAARFVQWPDAAFSSDAAPIVIGVLGDNPITGVLQQAVKGETANNRQLVVKRLSRGQSSAGCHVLLISRSESGRLDGVLKSLDDSSVLTVSEMDQFAQRGGIIGLVMQENNVRFEVNTAAARKAGLNISSRLLSLAKIVK